MLATAALVWILGAALIVLALPGHPVVTGVVVAGLGIISVWLFKGLYGFFEGSLEGAFLSNRAALVARWQRRFDLLSRFGADFTPPIMAGVVAGGGVVGAVVAGVTHTAWWIGIAFGTSLAASFVLICKNVGGAALGANYGLMAGIVFGPFYSIILAGAVASLMNTGSQAVEAGGVVIGARMLGIFLATFVTWPGCAVLGYLIGAAIGALMNVMDASSGRDISASLPAALLAALLGAGLAVGTETADQLWIGPLVGATLGVWLSTRPLRPE